MKYSILSRVQYTRRILQRTSTDNYRSIVLQLCRDYENYDFCLTIQTLIRKEDFSDLIDFADSLSSQVYEDATEHFVANQFAAIIKKYPFPPGSHKNDPEKKAYDKFIKSEHICKRVNQRIRARRSRKGRPAPLEPDFSRMRNFIRYTIGEAPSLSEIWSKCGFGPGASLGVHGNATNFARKLLSHDWSVSPGAFEYAYGALMSHAQFREVLLPDHCGFSSGDPSMRPEREAYFGKSKLVNHNKIVFVPKTAKTFRSIAVEPLLNGYVQKGCDEALRLRLKRIGIDLSDQEPNRQMAREGSSDDEDSFCTIDLSSASDSISIELCRELLPPDWYYFLNSIRSKSFLYKSEIKPFEKFCSMGNGFCFPLETLLFTAACVSVGAGRPGIDFRVYGDDIIVRKQFFEPVVLLLKYMGFSVNTDKTFSEGPFRESCGSDWFNGKDVRPFTLDFALDSVQNVFKFLNLTCRSQRTVDFFAGCRPFVLRLLPESLLLYRPYPGNADSAITALGSEFLTSTNCSFSRKKRAWVWRELQSSVVPDYLWTTLDEKSGSAALVFGALSGSASAAPFTMRNTTRTKMRVISHPGATSQWLPR